jgi:hypothetical protein
VCISDSWKGVVGRQKPRSSNRRKRPRGPSSFGTEKRGVQQERYGPGDRRTGASGPASGGSVSDHQTINRWTVIGAVAAAAATAIQVVTMVIPMPWVRLLISLAVGGVAVVAFFKVRATVKAGAKWASPVVAYGDRGPLRFSCPPRRMVYYLPTPVTVDSGRLR